MCVFEMYITLLICIVELQSASLSDLIDRLRRSCAQLNANTIQHVYVEIVCYSMPTQYNMFMYRLCAVDMLHNLHLVLRICATHKVLSTVYY